MMSLAERLRDDEEGSAVVEFIFLSIGLMIPIIYVILSVAQLQASSLAAIGAADHAAKVFVGAENEGEARARASSAVSTALTNMGVPAENATTSISCSEACLEPGSTVTVSVHINVPLPMLPEGVGASVMTTSSEATHRVDRFG
ncbi:Flp pilus assembly protein TadG [Neomicrococcus lactis]|uniref:Flp pilus assembly protein TadG n=2 Tax=Neomicrococcus lactis TaxID=732241 RepID=A0A7W8YAF5_9MICC|nr:hypothetical protein [Neomicrococcus lactis]MBB5597896.1 Flp pilus assembly protein TadG [Neomicrococcus lactis]